MHGAKHIDPVPKVKIFLLNGSVMLLLVLLHCPGAVALRLYSPDLRQGGWFQPKQLFHGDGCTGLNQPPDLYWTDIPKGTRSLAITLFDPDAANGQGWWHWIAFNIPAVAQHLASHPKALQSAENDFGSQGYGGPCPPIGDAPHHYLFTLFALPLSPLPAFSDRNTLIQWLNQHALAKATLGGRYGR